MGTITDYGSKHNHKFELTVIENSYDIEQNTSEVSYEFTIYKESYSWSGYDNIYYTVNIDGEDFDGTIPNYTAGNVLKIKTGTKRIAHNADGSKNLKYSFKVSDFSGQSYTCGNAEASGNMDLTNIPRYTTVTNSIRDKSLTSISVNWETSDPRDWTQYSLNGGAWTNANDTVASDNKSGYYTINNLTPNTTYTIKTRCRRKDSALWSEATKTLTETTYDIARISAEDFNLGDNFNINIANPSGQATIFFMETLNGETREATIREETKSAGTHTISLTDEELDMIYKKMGNGNTATIRIGVKTIDTYYNWQDKICTLTGNQKTARVNVNGNVKRAKAFVNINGVAKRAIVYINDNGVARRCI